MTCNKCGANIEENSKFCGYCGNAVEGNLQNNASENAEKETTVISNNNLEKTVRVDTSEINNELSITENNIPESVNQTSVETPNNNGNKKSNKLLIIIGGIVLGVIAIALVIFAFFKSNSDSVVVLEKAINNMYNEGKSSATVDAALTVKTATGDGLSISLTVKTEAEDMENYKTQITLNKSLLFDEINIYSSVDKSEMKVYLESGLIDMLGMSSSLEPIWLYYKLPLDGIEDMITTEQEKLNLSEIIDKEHFKYIDNVDGLKHYILTIDQKLIDKAKSKLSNIDDEELKEMMESMDQLEKAIEIDFYITKSDELSKIEISMDDFLQEEDGLSGLVMSMEFKDLGNTKVSIPDEALNSTTDIETYIASNALQEDLDVNMDENNLTNDGLNTELDINGSGFGF